MWSVNIWFTGIDFWTIAGLLNLFNLYKLNLKFDSFNPSYDSGNIFFKYKRRHYWKSLDYITVPEVYGKTYDLLLHVNTQWNQWNFLLFLSKMIFLCGEYFKTNIILPFFLNVVTLQTVKTLINLNGDGLHYRPVIELLKHCCQT